MNLTHESISTRMDLFNDLVDSAYNLSHFIYSCDGELLEVGNEKLAIFHHFFSFTGCLNYMMEYSKSHIMPIVLSAQLGLLWFAAFEYIDNKLYRIYVYGPAFHTDISLSALQKRASKSDIPLSWRRTFLQLMTNLPTISSTTLSTVAVMAHRAVTDVSIQITDVAYQQVASDHLILSPTKELLKRDRTQTYIAEQEMLRAIKEGNLNYSNVLSKIKSLSNGTPLDTDDPFKQAYVSIIVHITLCTRAAIEGGLTPDKAYTTGDSYIDLANACKNISELISVGSGMYREFIQLVHAAKEKDGTSSVIQSCCDYIHMHAEKQLSLQDLADRYGYSEYYLSRKFKNEVGCSIRDYINQQRVERAKALLVSTNDHIQDIGDRLNFGTRSYFSYTFKEITGMSPYEYRKKYQKK